MDQTLLSSRAIIGMYYARLEALPLTSLIDALSNDFGSDQSSETYNWIGMPPAMREWIGGRQAKGFLGNGITIANKHYEATIEVQKKDARRDKTGQIEARMQDFADRAQTHWVSLLSTLLLNGATALCYDGQYFFDTDHSEGSSGSQSNKIDCDISTMPAQVHGTVTAPSTEEMQSAIFAGITKMLGFVDDQGEPMNEGASAFTVIVPMTLLPYAAAAIAAVSNPALNNLNPNLLRNFSISVEPNARLSTWTDKFVVARTDSPIKAFIRQSEQETEMKAKAEGSEYEFDNDAWQFGIDNWRGAGYGLWQRAVQVTMT